MRTKNHHLKERNGRWSLRYSIPEDVRAAYPVAKARTQEESLGTKNVVEARKMRDERLAELCAEWDRLRNRVAEAKRTAPMRAGPLDLVETERNKEAEIDHLLDEINERAMAYYEIGFHESEREALRRARDIHAATPEGKEDTRRLNLLTGKWRLLRPLCDEWLSGQHKTKSVMYDYGRALDLLCEEFEAVEEVDHLKARRFLARLLSERKRPTVQKYTTPYRGVWEMLGLGTSCWRLKGIDTPNAATKRQPWADDEYLTLLKAAAAAGDRTMWLVVRIAAHTGASLQGLSRLEVRNEPKGCTSVYLHETKKEHRSRVIPCHPAILADVREWESMKIAAQPISKRFGRLKSRCGFGEEKVLHGFRHSVANRLERAGEHGHNIKRLLGHRLNDITFDIYSADGPSHEVLERAVGRLRWPELSWEEAGGA